MKTTLISRQLMNFTLIWSQPWFKKTVLTHFETALISRQFELFTTSHPRVLKRVWIISKSVGRVRNFSSFISFKSFSEASGIFVVYFLQRLFWRFRIFSFIFFKNCLTSPEFFSSIFYKNFAEASEMFSFIFYQNFCDPSEFSHLFFSKDFPGCPKLF